jgi:hypothetical protein
MFEPNSEMVDESDNCLFTFSTPYYLIIDTRIHTHTYTARLLPLLTGSRLRASWRLVRHRHRGAYEFCR